MKTKILKKIKTISIATLMVGLSFLNVAFTNTEDTYVSENECPDCEVMCEVTDAQVIDYLQQLGYGNMLIVAESDCNRLVVTSPTTYTWVWCIGAEIIGHDDFDL